MDEASEARQEVAGEIPEGAIPPPRISSESTPKPSLGYNLDGTPKKSRAGRPRKSGTPGAPPKTGTRRTSSRTAAATGPDYRPGIIGLFQLPAGALTAAGMVNPVFALDGLTIAMHAPNIAEALNDMAKSNPAVAAALDYVLQVGPYGAIIAAVLPMVAQLLANHGVLPPGIMGTIAPDKLQEIALSQFGAAA